MNGNFCAGDICVSLAGRDKGKYFLIVKVDGDYAFIVDGKTRKVLNPKKKKLKHLQSTTINSLDCLAKQISNGQPVANGRVLKCLKAISNKK